MEYDNDVAAAIREEIIQIAISVALDCDHYAPEDYARGWAEKRIDESNLAELLNK